MSIHKLIIIGSGPAGHTAAVYAARANLKPVMIEGLVRGGVAGGQLMITTDVENYPGFPEGIAGPKLMELFKRQSVRFGTEIISADVERVDLSAYPFKIWTDERHYEAQSVIVATGASARSRGHDHALRFVVAFVSPDLEGVRTQVDSLDVGADDLGAETNRLAFEELHQLRTRNAFGEAGIVLHISRDHQLAAGDSAPDQPLDHHGLQVGAGGVDRRGVPGRTRSDDDQLVNRHASLLSR